jgi:hypothetical protein
MEGTLGVLKDYAATINGTPRACNYRQSKFCDYGQSKLCNYDILSKARVVAIGKSAICLQ